MIIIYYDSRVCGAKHIVNNLLLHFPHTKHTVEYTTTTRTDAKVEVDGNVLYVKKISDYNRGFGCLACFFPEHLRGTLSEKQFADMTFSNVVGYYDQYKINP